MSAARRDLPPSRYRFDVDHLEPGQEHVGRGADLAPGTLLAAYTAGAFPMGVDLARPHRIDWWSPDPRGVLLPGGARISRSTRRARRRLRVTLDEAFDDVVAACGDPSRPGAWITEPIRTAYGRLHRLGWAHSVEVWQDDALVGGLYGVGIGGLFAGESMFHHVTDASKVAVAVLVDVVFADGDPRRLIDVQWSTPHLASLGVVEVDREGYRRRAERAIELPEPTWLLRSGDAEVKPGERSSED